jgi:hypothetical protein
LELSTSTGDSPFLIGGDRVTVTGPQRAPVAAVVIDGRLAATGVSASLGRPANFAVAPGRLRREWVGASGSSMETIIASPTLPLAAIQWARPEGAPLVVSLTLLPGTEPLLYHAVGGSIIAIRPDAPDQQVLITLCPLGGEWSVEEVTGGGLHITTQMDGAEPVTLLVTAGSHGDLAAALKAAPHLEAHEYRGRPPMARRTRVRFYGPGSGPWRPAIHARLGMPYRPSSTRPPGRTLHFSPEDWLC